MSNTTKKTETGHTHKNKNTLTEYNPATFDAEKFIHDLNIDDDRIIDIILRQQMQIKKVGDNAVRLYHAYVKATGDVELETLTFNQET